MSGWIQRDTGTQQRWLTGILTEAHVSDSDDDTSLFITPDPVDQASMDLLVNHNGDANVGGQVECEVNVQDNWRDRHLTWVKSLVSTDPAHPVRVMAAGIWVDDTGHQDKTELHPLDVIFGEVTSSLLAEDWIGELAAAQGLVVGQGLFAFRFAAATDVRQAGEPRPPLAAVTREFTIPVPMPTRPGGGHTPAWNLRSDLDSGVLSFFGTPHSDGTFLDFTFTLKARQIMQFVDPDDGPAVFLGEIATFWGPPEPDPCPPLLREIQRLNDQLDAEPGPSPAERKRIVARIGELTRQAERLHCL